MNMNLASAIARITTPLALLLCHPVFAQSVSDRFEKLDQNGDGKLSAAEAGTLGFFKPADVNRDGFVTREEAQAFAQKSSSRPVPDSGRRTGLEGDGAGPVFHWPVDAIRISEADCPLETLEAKASDGRSTRVPWRKPQGVGPFPTIVFVHGGLTQFPESSLRQHLTDNPVITRFLSRGYAVVMATFRTYEQDVQSRGPIEDVRAIVQQTAMLPGIDPDRIALYGGSGGGSIALELGGDSEVRAIVAGEPATVLYTGMLTTGEYGPRLEMMASPEKYFTSELRARTLAKLKTIRVPVLMLHGDRHDLHKLNKPLFLPLMQEAGIAVEYREYPGYGHGFYFGGGEDRWGKGADETVVEQVVSDAAKFLSSAMHSPPQAPVEDPAHANRDLQPAVTAKLSATLEQAIANREIAGVIGLIHDQGERKWFESFGWQNLESRTPMSRDAIFRLKSMSKPVVTVGALVLFDEGRFSLDEPISKHLPEWQEPRVLEDGQLVAARTQITPRMLMTHSSGLYYQLPGKPAFSGMPPRDEHTTLEEYSRRLAAQPLLFHPGEKYQYGTSIDVLGRFIEAVSGMPLDQFLRERVFEPLGMPDTDFQVPAHKRDRLAQLYRQPAPGMLAPAYERYPPTQPTKLFMGGGGLMSTTEDYERFCRMLMNRGELEGRRVLQPETVDMMFRNHLPESLGQKYGLGGAVDGAGGYWWGGANGTQFWLDRSHSLFTIFMVQTQNYKAPTWNSFRALVSEASGIPANGGVSGGNPLRAAFRQRDLNEDGRLDRAELSPALFERLESDGDGFVSESEFGALRRSGRKNR